MPHPDRLVEIDVQANTGASPREQFATPALIGSASTEPTDGFNNITRHTTAVSVADAYGDGSDVHIAAQETFAEGAQALWAVVLEATEVTEVLGNSASTSTSTGTVSNVPISGTSPVAITVDGTAQDVSATTETPPTQPQNEGEATYNSDTGEVAIGGTTSGTGPGIEVTYTTLSWPDGLEQVAGVGADLVGMADYRVGRAAIGDFEELTTWGDANDAAIPVPYLNGQQFTTVDTALDLAHEVGAYLTSKFGFPISSESGDNITGRVIGRYAVNEPWYNIFLKTLPLSVPVPTRYAPYIGAPELAGTFEGGATTGSGGSDSGAGPSNVLLDDGGTVLSNSLSLAGLESDYRYLDIARLEAYVKDRIRVAIGDAFSNNDVRFNDTGRTTIKEAIAGELNPITGDQNQPLRQYTSYVPRPEDIPEQSRANRIWAGIEVEVTISGYAHRADVTLVISV